MFNLQGKARVQNALAQAAAISKSQAVIEFNLDGTIITANQNFLSTLGYSLDEIKGKHHSMFVEPAVRDSNDYREFWARLNRGEFQAAQYKRIGKGGKEIWIQASYNPILDAKGKPIKVIKFATDITAQKIQNMEDAGKIAAMSRAQAVIEFNMDGTIVTANENFLGAMGYSLAEVQGKHHSMFVTPADRDSAAYREFWAALNRGDYQAAEYKRVGKGGKEVWILATYNPIFNEAGKPFKVVKFATDVTEQKLKAADSDGQISAIGKSQAVIEFNMDGTIRSANQNFLDAMGYVLAEIQGKHHSMFVEPEERNSRAYRGVLGDPQSRPVPGRGIQAHRQGRPRNLDSGLLQPDPRPQRQAVQGSEIRNRHHRAGGGAQEGGTGTRPDRIGRGGQRGNERLDPGNLPDHDQIQGRPPRWRRAASKPRTSRRMKLNSAAQAMSGIVQLIGDITGQINLLALNATIESARAGEAGRGFAVVASEVKNLANQAKQATDTISGEIEALNNVAGDVVSSLIAIKTAIGSVNEFITSTAAAVEEQSTVTSDMSSNMQRAAAELA